MAEKIKSYDEFISEIKDSISYHLEESAIHIAEANRLGQLIGYKLPEHHIKNGSEVPGIANGSTNNVSNEVGAKAIISRAPFEEANAEILSDGMPRTVKQLSAEYTKRN
ncbi:MAG: hypothetical protein EOO07_21770, partial [Chitinophagaceae bacterium]